VVVGTRKNQPHGKIRLSSSDQVKGLAERQERFKMGPKEDKNKRGVLKKERFGGTKITNSRGHAPNQSDPPPMRRE